MKRILIALVVIAGLLAACGPGKCDTGMYAKQLEPKFQEFQDAVTLAGSTPRVQLAAPLADLQKIRRDTGQIEIDPSCTEVLKAHSYLLDGMDYTVKGFISFLGQEPDYMVDSQFTMATQNLDSFNDMIEGWNESQTP